MMMDAEHKSTPQMSADSTNCRHVAFAAEFEPNGISRRRQSWAKHRVALIDEFPLRRTSTLNLLSAHIREGARPFKNAAELLMHVPMPDGAPRSVLMSVGRRSVTEPQMREQLQCLRRALASTPVIVLSDRDDPEEVVAAFREGARGYVPTSLEPHLVIEAIRMVLSGGAFVPAEVMMRSRREIQPELRPELREEPSLPPNVPVAHGEQWPPRQLAVLHLLVQGRANKEIARALTMEESTVKVHVRHIMRKLGVVNRTQAALSARRLGIAAASNALRQLDGKRTSHWAEAPPT